MDPCWTDERIAHSNTQNTSGMGDSMSHGRTDEIARWPVAVGPTAAGAKFNHTFTGNITNGHGDQSPPASGEGDGHAHIHMAPDQDAHTHTDNTHCGHYPTLKSHHQAPLRDEDITQWLLQQSFMATSKRSKKAPLLTDRVTRCRA